jgi:hypothetical protein
MEPRKISTPNAELCILIWIVSGPGFSNLKKCIDRDQRVNLALVGFIRQNQEDGIHVLATLRLNLEIEKDITLFSRHISSYSVFTFPTFKTSQSRYGKN